LNEQNSNHLLNWKSKWHSIKTHSSPPRQHVGDGPQRPGQGDRQKFGVSAAAMAAPARRRRRRCRGGGARRADRVHA
jgi:hypothetical protein